MEFRQVLLDTEMALRDLAGSFLEKEHGEEWQLKCGLPPERIASISETMNNSIEINNSLSKEYRLINYFSFNDLGEVIYNHWETYFKDVFGDLATFKVYLALLKRFSDTDTLGRPLLTHQKHLILGVSGVLRNKIVAHRSFAELGKEGFPRIESIQDNLGNLWIPGKPKKLKTKNMLVVGDNLELVISAADPEDSPIEYRLFPHKWQNGNVLLLEIEESHIGVDVNFQIGIRSLRKHHAYPRGYDDRVTFQYTVLPREEKG